MSCCPLQHSWKFTSNINAVMHLVQIDSNTPCVTVVNSPSVCVVLCATGTGTPFNFRPDFIYLGQVLKTEGVPLVNRLGTR